MPYRCMLTFVGLLLCVVGPVAMAEPPTTFPTSTTAPGAFSLRAGAYPSKNLIDYEMDFGDFLKANPGASDWTLVVNCNGKQVLRESRPLFPDFATRMHEFVNVGMSADAVYTVTAIISDKSGKQLGRTAADAPLRPYFLAGAYPSKGLIEYDLDCRDFLKAHPTAANWTLGVDRDATSTIRESHPLKDGRAQGFVNVGKMPDGAKYTISATIADDDGRELTRQTDTFTRHVMPFETAPRAGVSDIVVPPFTPPVLGKSSVSCWGRTYQHGPEGLFQQIKAADQNLLARPASFMARVNGGGLAALHGEEPKVSGDGPNRSFYDQTFAGQGIVLKVHGDFDYDGFYKFTATLAPQGDGVDLQELRLDIPFKDTIAQLIEASVTWRRIQGTQKECMGDLDPKQGVLWDSHTFPSRNWERVGNMPPFIWVGDDDRGLVYSCASEEGMHNDEKLAAAQLERKGSEVIYTAWFANSPIHLDKARTFQFAFQASPFKAMPEYAHLWRNGGTPYKNGVSFSNWFTDGCYPLYGRYLTLDLLKEKVQKCNVDQVGVMASAYTENGGTPEYLQFWCEWGKSNFDTNLMWPKYKRGPLEDWAVKMMQEAKLPVNPYVRSESPSNACATNIDYRVWWLKQTFLHSGISFIYQDNPPYPYAYDPPNGYGYIRDDGRKETTSAVWTYREYPKRVATAAIEAGLKDSPYLWLNAISPIIPGRSFARRMLNGEYLYTKLFTLGQIRVLTSKQWGMVLDWYPFPQTEESPYPNVGPTREYWRACYSRLLLHDITSFSGGDNPGYSGTWLSALDLFWLDDPTVQWHPYYRNDTLASTARNTTFVSTYTAKGRALFFVSNQGKEAIVETVHSRNLGQFGAADLKYFYDAETGEEVETTADGALKLFIPGADYRVVIGFPTPWKFPAKQVIAEPELPAQSTLDPDLTLAAISKQLLTSPTLQPIPGAHRLYEEWMKKIIAELPVDGKNIIYFDAKACSDVDLGRPGITCSVFYSKKHGVMLVNYYNDSDQPVNLPLKVRDALAKKVGKEGHNYIVHPVYGNSEWELIDIPAHRGLLELYYSYLPAHVGPLGVKNMAWNIANAIEDNRQSLGGRPLRK